MSNNLKYFDKYKQKIFVLLNHCKQNILYYNYNWKFILPVYDDFSYEFYKNTIPLLDKSNVRNNSEQFLDRRITKDSLSIDTTSGTEGKPIICYRSKAERVCCASVLWKLRRKVIPDLLPESRFAHFYAYRNVNFEIVSNQILYKKNDISLPLYNLSDICLCNYWKEIVKFRPRWLHGPVSTIYAIASVVKKYNLEQFKFELIELNGEFVSKSQLDFIMNTIAEHVIDVYGCREYWPIAYGIDTTQLQVASDCLYLEDFYNQGLKLNELILTTLNNNTWPLIRYRLGDIGVINYENDKVLVDIVSGRVASFFKLNGIRYNAIVFSGIMRAICELYGQNIIVQFQVKLKSSFLHIYLVLSNGANARDIINLLKKELIRIFGDDIFFDIEIVPYIYPNSVTGKVVEFMEE